MKKDYLKELNELISVMNSSEKLLVLKQLSVGYSNLKANEKKMLQLFQLVKTGDQKNYEKLKKKVSPNSSSESFNRLLRRLTYRLEDSLIFEQNINRKNQYSDLFRIKYKLKKQIAQAQILLSRGLINKAISIWKRVQRDALKYEQFPELIEAATMYFIVLIDRNESKALKVRSEIETYIAKRNSLEKIRIKTNEHQLISDKIKNKNSLLKSLQSTIYEIQVIQNECYTVNGQTYLHLLELEYADGTNNFKSFIKHGQHLIDLLYSERSVYSKNRIIFLTNKLSTYYRFLLDFEKSKQMTLEAFKLLDKTRNINYLISFENLILANFFLFNLKECISIIDESLYLEITSKFLDFRSKFSFYKAATHFLLKDYRQSLTNLNQTTEIEKDKEGWNIWIRLLRVMILIEQDKQGLLEYEIESFRKYIQRSEIKSNERINLILSLLIELERRDFDFSLASEKRVEELSRLENDEKVCWSINSPELIQFHTWFKAKRDGVEYQAVFKS